MYIQVAAVWSAHVRPMGIYALNSASSITVLSGTTVIDDDDSHGSGTLSFSSTVKTPDGSSASHEHFPFSKAMCKVSSTSHCGTAKLGTSADEPQLQRDSGGNEINIWKDISVSATRSQSKEKHPHVVQDDDNLDDLLDGLEDSF